jgi:hypothetical protein
VSLEKIRKFQFGLHINYGLFRMITNQIELVRYRWMQTLNKNFMEIIWELYEIQEQRHLLSCVHFVQVIHSKNKAYK